MSIEDYRPTASKQNGTRVTASAFIDDRATGINQDPQAQMTHERGGNTVATYILTPQESGFA